MTFIEKLSAAQTEIPAAAMRIAGFFLLIQGVLIFLQKKNDPQKSVWEDLSGVLLAGLVVFLFPELVRFVELAVAAAMPLNDGTPHVDSIAEYMRSAFDGLSDEAQDDSLADTVTSVTLNALNPLSLLQGRTATYLIAHCLLKPLADLVNTLCFPTYLFIRSAGLRVCYLIAPLVLMLGAFAPFRPLWKHWFMVYIALLVSGPALILANRFCEEAFALYIECTDSPVLGFIMVALARFKIFQSVMDLSYRIFRV